MAERIRIMRVVTRLNVGGPSRHIRLLMEGLDCERFDQCLVTGSVRPGENEDEDAAAFVHHRIPQLRRSIRPWLDFTARRRLAHLIREFSPHLVHTHQAKAGILGRSLAVSRGGPQFVHTFHGHTFRNYWRPPFQQLVVAAERRAAALSQALIVQSDSQGDDLVTFLGEEQRGKIRLIPPALDIEALEATQGQPSLLRSQLGLTREKIVVFLGRLAEVKNPHSFLRIVKRLQQGRGPGCVGLVVGAGHHAMETELHDLVDSLDLRAKIRWLGYRRDIASILSLADVCVCTSRSEGTPLSLLEALYFGARVASFAVGGVEDMLKGLKGTALAESGHEEQLAHGIMKLLQQGRAEGEELENLRITLRRRFGAQRLLQDMSALYDDLLSR